jgi:hypothetical protein
MHVDVPLNLLALVATATLLANGSSIGPTGHYWIRDCWGRYASWRNGPSIAQVAQEVKVCLGRFK